MIILAVSLVAGLLAGAVVFPFFNLVGAVLPAVAVFAGVYFWMGRRVGQQMEQVMAGLQPMMMKQQFDQAIALLEQAKVRFGNMQFFTKGTIDGQIGSIHYLRKDFDRARPFLESAFVRHWSAKAMLGVLQFKQKDYAGMDKTLERAAKYSPKQGMLWSLWAYLHAEAGNADRAIQVLNRGKDQLDGKDPHILANLEKLQNGKKMAMRGYGDSWYQFHLELPKGVQPQGRRGFREAPKNPRGNTKARKKKR